VTGGRPAASDRSSWIKRATPACTVTRTRAEGRLPMKTIARSIAAAPEWTRWMTRTAACGSAHAPELAGRQVGCPSANRPRSSSTSIAGDVVAARRALRSHSACVSRSRLSSYARRSAGSRAGRTSPRRRHSRGSHQVEGLQDGVGVAHRDGGHERSPSEIGQRRARTARSGKTAHARSPAGCPRTGARTPTPPSARPAQTMPAQGPSRRSRFHPLCTARASEALARAPRWVEAGPSPPRPDRDDCRLRTQSGSSRCGQDLDRCSTARDASGNRPARSRQSPGWPRLACLAGSFEVLNWSTTLRATVSPQQSAHSGQGKRMIRGRSGRELLSSSSARSPRAVRSDGRLGKPPDEILERPRTRSSRPRAGRHPAWHPPHPANLDPDLRARAMPPRVGAPRDPGRRQLVEIMHQARGPRRRRHRRRSTALPDRDAELPSIAQAQARSNRADASPEASPTACANRSRAHRRVSDG
jgi:hypothetical protein